MKALLTSSERLSRARTALGRSELALLVLLLGGTGACSADALIYGSARSAATEAGHGGARGGSGGSGGNAGMANEAGRGGDGADIYGCGGMGAGGAGAIVMDILAGPGGVGDWLQNRLDCTVDADCAKTLLMPRCAPETSMCEQCAEPAQRAELSRNVIACIVSARERCCNDPGAPLDCVLRDCVMSCEEGR